MKCDP